ncbi:MAG: SpaA isopeptide-forming pilin-related protein [Oscillospiraceae bacterium]
MVYKRDSVTGAGIAGCRFQLRYLGGETSGVGGTVVGTYVTSANGSFTVTGLQKGLLHLRGVGERQWPCH